VDRQEKAQAATGMTDARTPARIGLIRITRGGTRAALRCSRNHEHLLTALSVSYALTEFFEHGNVNALA
jgi:hypothetical protein